MRYLLRTTSADPFGEDLVGSAARVYAYNTIVGTPLRQLTPAHVRGLGDVPLVQELARTGLAELGEAPDDDADLDQAGLRRGLRAFMRKRRFRPLRMAAMQPPLARNLGLLGRLLELSAPERQVLRLLVTLRLTGSLNGVFDALGELSLSSAAVAVAAATGQSRDACQALLRPGARLIDSGLVQLRLDADYVVSERFELKRGLVDLVLVPRLRRADVLPRFLDIAPDPSLSPADYGRAAGAIGVARDLLASALSDRVEGINVLIHGPTGTGKSELARLLAQQVRAPLYVAGRADDDGGPANARERLSSLLLAQRLVPAGKGLVVLDELEDLFDRSWVPFVGVRSKAQMSKHWFNDLLERNRVPTLWITNETDGIDRAFLRRFSYAIELRDHGPRQRARVLERHLGDDSGMSAEDIGAVAERFQASPAQLRTAVHTARACATDGRPDRATLEQILAPMERLVTGQEPGRQRVFEPARYRIDALRADTDLAALADRLAGWRPDGGAGLTLCLYGPPGTGKSEFARYLAYRMGRRVTCRRVSDILAMWVGSSERNLAAAFREAAEEDTLLLFDEADSFLRDRTRARARWEITETNEFLQQLESFTGVCAVTTNLWEDLDPAAMRRFVFKIGFRWLGLEQAVTLFVTTFADLVPQPIDEAAVRTALARIDHLAPGDFAAVRRRQLALGELAPADTLVAALAAECGVKSSRSRPIGFGAMDSLQ